MQQGMMKCSFKLVESEPEFLEPCVIFVSLEKARIWHSCLCGCGGRVVLPLTVAGWRVTFDGFTIEIEPGIINDHLECQSRYRITRSIDFTDKELPSTIAIFGTLEYLPDADWKNPGKSTLANFFAPKRSKALENARAETVSEPLAEATTPDDKTKRIGFAEAKRKLEERALEKDKAMRAKLDESSRPSDVN